MKCAFYGAEGAGVPFASAKNVPYMEEGGHRKAKRSLPLKTFVLPSMLQTPEIKTDLIDLRLRSQ